MRLEDIIGGIGELSLEEIAYLKKHKYQIQQDTPSRIKYNLAVINFNLKQKDGIDRISKIYLEKNQRVHSTLKDTKELRKILIKLGKKGKGLYWSYEPWLIRVNPEFAFITDRFENKDSLIDNYNFGLQVFNWNCNNNQKQRLYKQLIKRKFVLSPQERLTPIQDSEFLFASLKNDFQATMEFLKKYDNMPLYFLNQDELTRFNSILKSRRMQPLQPSYDFSFIERIKNNVNDGMIGILEATDWGNEGFEVSNKTYEEHLKMFNYLGNTPSFINEQMITNPYVFNKLVSNEHERAFISEVMWTRKNYNKKDEKRLLLLLESEEDKIENVISKWIEDDRKREDLSVLEIYALGFYQKKYLNERGLKDVQVNCFEYSSTLGGYWNDNKSLSVLCNRPGKSVKDELGIILHESNHALQFNNVKQMNFDLDPDIDLYTKDIMLRRLFGEKYYDINYESISYEFDADLVQDMEQKKIYGIKRNKYEPIFEDFQISITDKYKMNLDRTIDSKKYDIHELTEKVIQDYVIHPSHLVDFPLLEYEYVIDKYGNEHNAHQRSIEELCQCLVSSKTEKDKGIYRYLISRRLNSRVYKNYQENISTLKEIAKSDNEVAKEAAAILIKHEEKEKEFENANVEVRYTGILSLQKTKIKELKTKIAIANSKAKKEFSEMSFVKTMSKNMDLFRYVYDKKSSLK